VDVGVEVDHHPRLVAAALNIEVVEQSVGVDGPAALAVDRNNVRVSEELDEEERQCYHKEYEYEPGSRLLPVQVSGWNGRRGASTISFLLYVRTIKFDWSGIIGIRIIHTNLPR
jgi:hypothetical protein